MFGLSKLKPKALILSRKTSDSYDRRQAALVAARRLGYRLEYLNKLMLQHTGVNTLEDFLGEEGGPDGYRPTLKGSQTCLLLADAYDIAREYQGDPRRAFRGLSA
jgi:hypothetical protein